MEHSHYACEHVFDAADGTGANESSSVWRYPHPAGDGSTRCLFHRPVRETRPAAVIEVLREAVTDDERPSTFVGTAFERVGLAGVTLPPDARLDFRGAVVKSDIDPRDATLDGAPRLDRVSIGGAACMQRFDTTGAVSCRHLQVGDHWVLCEVELNKRFNATGFGAGSVVATEACFESGATFREGVVDDDVPLAKSRFDGPAWFSHTRLGGRLNLGNVAFDHRLSLAHCRIHTGVVAASATVEGGLSLERVIVDGELNAARLTVDSGIDATTAASGDQIDCTGLTARDGPVDFTYSVFDGPVYFDNATVGGWALRFRNARFGSGPALLVRMTVDRGFDPSNAVCSADSPVRLVEAMVDGSAICSRARFGNELFYSGVRVRRDVDFSDYIVGALTFGIEIEGRLNFAYAYMTDAATFGDTVVHGPARFTSVRFGASPSLTEAVLNDTVTAYDISVESAGDS